MTTLEVRIEGDTLYEFVQRQLMHPRAFDDGLRVGINWVSLDGTKSGVITGYYRDLATAQALLDRVLAT